MNIETLQQKELDKLYQEIQQALAEIASLEKYAVGASGGIFAWLLTDGKAVHHTIAYFLPAILTLLFGLIVLGLFDRIGLIGKYIKNYYEPPQDPDPAAPPAPGWEHFLDRHNKARGSILASSRALLWLALLLVDLAIAFALLPCDC